MQICKISSKYSEIRKTTSKVYATKGIQKCEHDNREKCEVYPRQALGPSCVDILDASPTWMKKNIKFSEIRMEDKWRVDLLREITNINQQVLQFNSEDSFLSSDQLQEIVDFVSTS